MLLLLLYISIMSAQLICQQLISQSNIKSYIVGIIRLQGNCMYYYIIFIFILKMNTKVEIFFFTVEKEIITSISNLQ